MNTRKIYGLFIIVMLFVTSCTDKGIVNYNSSDQENPKLSTELTDDKLAQYLVDLGFRPDMIELKDKGYLVEGDIFFSKDRLHKEADNFDKRKSGGKEQDPEIQQWVTDYVVSINNVDDIVISVASSVPNSWETAVNQAVTEWNQMNNVAVSMSVNNNSNNPDIQFVVDNSISAVAEAGPPINGQPYPEVKINTGYNHYSGGQKKYTMVHELGHTIGFRHTNWDSRNEPEPEGGRLNFTPSTDDNSVMNGGTGGLSWNGFSTYDIYGTQVMYPESLGGSITSTMEDSEYKNGRVTFYFRVFYDVTGGLFQTSMLQKKVNGSWEDYIPGSIGNDEFKIRNERIDTMAGTELRIKYTNYAGDVVAYSSPYTVTL